MPANNVVAGQKIDAGKIARARELRRSMTAEEMQLWEQLRRNRLQGLHFRRQQVVDGLIVDFYCHAASLVVEVDGGIHKARVAYDRERDRVLAKRGLRVLHVTAADVRANLADVVRRISEACHNQT